MNIGRSRSDQHIKLICGDEEKKYEDKFLPVQGSKTLSKVSQISI